MIKKIIPFLFVLSSAFIPAAFGAVKITCEPVTAKAQNKNIILSGPEQKNTAKIYLIQNIYKQSLWVDHPVDKPSASAGWSSYLRPGKWSALLLNRKDFTLSCAEIKPGKVDYQNCKKAISVCVIPKFEFETKRKGSYWLAEDKTYEELLIALEKRGVKFK